MNPEDLAFLDAVAASEPPPLLPAPERPRLDSTMSSPAEPLRDLPPLPPGIEELLRRDPLLADEIETQRRRKRARVLLAEIEALEHPQPAPDAGTLAEVLARPRTARWRVEGLLPARGRTLWTAMRKTGKTTALANLARSLLTGQPFLEKFDVQRLDGRFVLLNYEVDGETCARWLDEIGVPVERLFLVNLRGRRNLLADEAGRAELVELIRAAEGEVLAVDPFGRAFTGRSQNDAAEVGPWLVRLDEVAESAGCSELVVTAHAGWEGERTRGSSALEDWPDSVITMTRDDEDRRFLKAEGRDVDLDEDRLDYDPATRRLSLSGSGSRRQVKAAGRLDELARAAAEIVVEQPGVNVAGLQQALREAGHGVQRGDATKAALLAEQQGWLVRRRGSRNAVEHFPGSVVPSSPEKSPGRLVSSPDPSYRDGTTYSTTQPPSSPDPNHCAACSAPVTPSKRAVERGWPTYCAACSPGAAS